MTICMKCKNWISAIGSIHQCKASPIEPVYDYVTGKRLNLEYAACEIVNTEGECKLYEEA